MVMLLVFTQAATQFMDLMYYQTLLEATKEQRLIAPIQVATLNSKLLKVLPELQQMLTGGRQFLLVLQNTLNSTCL